MVQREQASGLSDFAGKEDGRREGSAITVDMLFW